MKVLVIGYGSIGSRHAKILSNFKNVSQVYVYSKQENIPYKTLSDLNEIIKINFDYIIVASTTNLHFDHLCFLDKHLKNSKILVEKPLFNFFKNYKPLNNLVFVGYNLRFHPVLSFVKNKIKDKKLWNAKIECFFIPSEWRSNLEYSKSSSAFLKFGGGVIRDLSHEIDYALWLFGHLNITYFDSQKLSNLDIETDDFLHLVCRNETLNVQISLSYFSKIKNRSISIDGENFSIKGDLISNTVHLIDDKNDQIFRFPAYENNKTYEEMHKSILADDFSNVCSYSEGLNTMKIIKLIEN